MLCQNCKERQATVYIKNIVNQQQTELHLCPQCAKELGYTANMTNPFSGFAKEMDTALDPFSFLFASPEKKIFDKPQSCPLCGTTSNDIRRTGRAGCANCYSLFDAVLDPIIRKIHGTATHTGNIPKSAGANLSSKRHLDDLKAQLKAAIDSEDYESAAKLRDEIRGMEQNG